MSLFRPVIRMRSFWLSVLASVVAGLSIGVYLSWVAAIDRLDFTSDRASHTLLNTLSQLYIALYRPNLTNSPADLCNEDHLRELRRLVFESDTVKDIGVLPDRANLRCSAALGILDENYRGEAPDFVFSKTHRIWVDVPTLTTDERRVLIIQLGYHNALVDMGKIDEVPRVGAYDAAVVFTPIDAVPEILAGQVIGGLSDRLLKEMAGAHRGLVFSRFYTRAHSFRCATDFPFCAVGSLVVVAELLPKLPLIVLIAGLVGGLGALLFATAANRIQVHLQGSGRLKRALRDGELSVAYQPQVDFETGSVVGCEALLRGPDGDCALVPLSWASSPEDYRRIAAFVMDRAVGEVGDILRKDPSFSLSINVEAGDLLSGSLRESFKETVRRHSISPWQILFELVERDSWEDSEVLAAISDMKASGFRIAIDDFGTGYSNVATLEAAFIDVIKIDRSFVKAVGRDTVMKAMLDTLLAFGKKRDMTIVVEGIETESQAAYCKTGCPHAKAQGWYFGQPVSGADFTRRILGV